MEPRPDLLREIAAVLREAHHPDDSIEALSLVWNELLQLVDGERQPPDLAPRPQGYRVMQEFPFVAVTAEGAARIGELLASLGFEPGRPYARYGRTVVPVYSHRHPWLGRLLELVRPVPAEEAGEPPEEEIEAATRILRAAGLDGGNLPSDALREIAVAWTRVRPLIIGWRRPMEAGRPRSQIPRSRWELWLDGGDAEAPGRLSRVLRRMGLSPGRAWVQGAVPGRTTRLVVPVAGDRNHWIGSLLGPAETPLEPTGGAGPGRPTPVAPSEPLQVRRDYDPAVALQLVQGDPTFEQSVWQGRAVFAGRCSRCGELLLVGVDGEQVSRSRLARAGSGDSARLVLLCLRCAQRVQPRASRQTRQKAPVEPSPPREIEPEPELIERETTLDEIGNALRAAGVPGEEVEAQVRLWCQLLPAVDWARPGGRGKGEREIRFLAPNLLGAARIEALLRQMGIRPSRPYEEQGQIVVPVKEKRHPTLGALLSLGRLP